MKILSVDTATSLASVAILEDEKVLGEVNLNFNNSHSTILMDMMINLLNTLKLTLDDIHGFVVSKGPGSFTGLRIGISTIKGLCHGCNKPLIGVSSLDSLAMSSMNSHGVIVPIINALRDNVYTCLFRNVEGSLTKLTDYLLVSIYELKNLLNNQEKVLFVGDGVNAYGNTLTDLFPHCILGNDLFNYVKASSLGFIGMKYFKSGKKDDIITFFPLYIKKSYAEEMLEVKYNNE